MALLASRRRRLLVLSGWTVAVLGLLVAIPASRLSVRPAVGGPAVTAWPGAALAITAAGLLLAAAAGSDGLRSRGVRRPLGRPPDGRQPGRGHRGCWPSSPARPRSPPARSGSARASTDRSARPAARSCPRSVSDDAVSGAQVRTLVLSTHGSGVSYQLLRGTGLNLGDAELAPVPAAQSALRTAVAALAAPGGGQAVDQAQALARFDIGFVLMRAPVDPTLARSLDAVTGLRSVSMTASFDLWRLATMPSRVSVLENNGAVVPVPSGPVNVSGATAPAAGGTLLLAEPAGGWQATLNGHALTAVPSPAGSWAQAFRLPSGGGTLDISRSELGHELALALELLAALVVAVLALPGARSTAEAAAGAEAGAGAGAAHRGKAAEADQDGDLVGAGAGAGAGGVRTAGAARPGTRRWSARPMAPGGPLTRAAVSRLAAAGPGRTGRVMTGPRDDRARDDRAGGGRGEADGGRFDDGRLDGDRLDHDRLDGDRPDGDRRDDGAVGADRAGAGQAGDGTGADGGRAGGRGGKGRLRGRGLGRRSKQTGPDSPAQPGGRRAPAGAGGPGGSGGPGGPGRLAAGAGLAAAAAAGGRADRDRGQGEDWDDSGVLDMPPGAAGRAPAGRSPAGDPPGGRTGPSAGVRSPTGAWPYPDDDDLDQAQPGRGPAGGERDPDMTAVGYGSGPYPAGTPSAGSSGDWPSRAAPYGAPADGWAEEGQSRPAGPTRVRRIRTGRASPPRRCQRAGRDGAGRASTRALAVAGRATAAGRSDGGRSGRRGGSDEDAASGSRGDSGRGSRWRRGRSGDNDGSGSRDGTGEYGAPGSRDGTGEYERPGPRGGTR